MTDQVDGIKWASIALFITVAFGLILMAVSFPGMSKDGQAMLTFVALILVVDALICIKFE